MEQTKAAAWSGSPTRREKHDGNSFLKRLRRSRFGVTNDALREALGYH
jgi:hypothetical protein